MQKRTAFLVLLLVGAIGFMGCGGGGGGTAEAQVSPSGGGVVTILGAPRIVTGLQAIGRWKVNGCYVDGDIQVANNVLIFRISGGPTDSVPCQSNIGIEIIAPTPLTAADLIFRSR